VNTFTWGQSSKADEYLESGLGFGAGVAMNFPISRIVAFNTEMDFFYRTVYNEVYEHGDYEVKVTATEFALSVPLTVQVTPIPKVPIFFDAGVQLDVPFKTEWEFEECDDGDCDSDSEEFEKRSTVDVGIVIGAGYRFGFGLVLDFKSVIGLTTPSSDKDFKKASYNQYIFGVGYFF